MKLVFYSLTLNHHQAAVADALYSILGSDYYFVETSVSHESKGSTEDYSQRPYLITAWKNSELYNTALKLAETADVCMFGGNESLPFLKTRMRLNLLSFYVAEHWLKKGLLNILSPRLLLFLKEYFLGNWNNKKLYHLCASAQAPSDDKILGIFDKKCFKWGYFPKFSGLKKEYKQSDNIVSIMWCARFLNWKHPELPIQLAHRLKIKGYKFKLDMFGTGLEYQKIKKIASKMDVLDVVSFKGGVSNAEILKQMNEHDIFLLTSDRNEGWGVVANEAMSNGCVLVGSDAVGSTPYLVKDEENGCLFKSCNLDSLMEKMEWLLNNPDKINEISLNGCHTIIDIWSPMNAAKNLLQLIDDLQNERDSSIQEGPCSIAELS